MTNFWICGGSRSGKSDRITQQFQHWAEVDFSKHPNPQAASQSVLLLSVDSEQRQIMSDRLSIATHGRYPVTAATPLSFFRDQVLLFFPLLMRSLKWKAQFPILLRVENEQELAAKLWSDRLDSGLLSMEGVGRDRSVRRMLDLYLLAANSGKPIEQISQTLSQGMEGFDSGGTTDSQNPEQNASSNSSGGSTDNPKQQAIAWQNVCENIGDALVDWRDYCWQNGLLTYGTITELFGKHLLPNPQYRKKLLQRYRYLIGDDADEFPAIAGDLAMFLVENGTQALFTFNPEGSIRLGLGADPTYWQERIEPHCQVETLTAIPDSIGKDYADLVLELVSETSMRSTEAIDSFHIIDTISRAKLFRSVADTIASAIAAGQVKASEIAIIAPGLDHIANYALVEILSKKDISILPLNDQRPLSVSAAARSLITLMTLVYPNLGHLIGRDQVAEMLVTLTAIDPVRAGLLADRCFVPHPIQPQLLPSDTFSEWNRFGYEASSEYKQLCEWIERQSHSLTPLLFLDRAIQQFLQPKNLSYDQLSTLQELIETAQYYWQVGFRLNWQEQKIVEGFIQLIRQGTVTANPFAPNAPIDSVVLATIYQYRMARLSHRWQFWLDAGSVLWTQGGAAALFGAPLFLHNWNGEVWTIQDREEADRQRLNRLLRDLCDRAQERIYLCYSELSTNGQEQNGPLKDLADIAVTQTAAGL